MAKGFKGKSQNPMGMVNQLQKLQEQFQQAQDQLAKETVTHTAGGCREGLQFIEGADCEGNGTALPRSLRQGSRRRVRAFAGTHRRSRHARHVIQGVLP